MRARLVTSPQSALIIGASRGLGLGLAQEYLKPGWSVVGTVRGRAALHDLADRSGGRLEVETIDVVTPETIAALRQRLAGRRFDVLFVVAGVGSPRESIATVTAGEFNRIVMTNALGPTAPSRLWVTWCPGRLGAARRRR